MPQVGEPPSIWEAYRSYQFTLKVGTDESPPVTRISGLSLGEYETINQVDGGAGYNHPLSGKLSFQPLTIECYVLAKDSPYAKGSFADWVKKAFNLVENQGLPSSSVRRTGSITVYHQNQPVMIFTFHSAWVKSATFSDLDASASGMLSQTFVLEHEGLTWEWSS